MKKILIVIVFLSRIISLYSQYSPLPGWSGSDAISADSPLFREWANRVTVIRGYINIADTTATDNNSNRASFGNPGDATGKPDGKIVSLGDSGIAIVYFDIPLCDGQGWDFAVFENGFILSDDTTKAFLELARVQVSSDSIHFFEFPPVSLTQTDTQTGAFDGLDTRKINNLAGKYPVLWGTPFDLSELDDSEFLDKNNICCIKLIDVIGSIETNHYTNDVYGNKINDPFPTPYFSSGFDLDAVGAININEQAIANYKDKPKIYPNPFDYKLNIIFTEKILSVKIYDVSGKLLVSNKSSEKKVSIDTSKLKSGLYFCIVKSENFTFRLKAVKL